MAEFVAGEGDPKIVSPIVAALIAQKVPARKQDVSYSSYARPSFTYHRYVVAVPGYEPLEFTAADDSLLRLSAVHLISTNPPKPDFAGRKSWLARILRRKQASA